MERQLRNHTKVLDTFKHGKTEIDFIRGCIGEVTNTTTRERINAEATGGGAVNIEKNWLGTGHTGNISQTRLEVQSTSVQEVWIKPRDGGPDYHFTTTGYVVPLAQGQNVALIEAAKRVAGGSKYDFGPEPVIIYNASASSFSFLPPLGALIESLKSPWGCAGVAGGILVFVYGLWTAMGALQRAVGTPGNEGIAPIWGVAGGALLALWVWGRYRDSRKVRKFSRYMNAQIPNLVETVNDDTQPR